MIRRIGIHCTEVDSIAFNQEISGRVRGLHQESINPSSLPITLLFSRFPGPKSWQDGDHNQAKITSVNVGEIAMVTLL